ncbi:hypothetical protein CLU79DRAFT_744563 [Phycomyces nitens]|nr:hypothetical protein CLU79DRAFT_744563 [Phycomyces nitens]
MSSPIQNTPKKRKHIGISDQRKKSDPSSSESKGSATMPTPLVALSPPVMPYPPLLSVVSPSYYPVYQHPFYLSVASPPSQPQQTPGRSMSLSSPRFERILPKSDSPHHQPYPVQPHFYHPFSISPQLHPTIVPVHPMRHNSTPTASNPSPASTTADQREQARKVSHSAIERRRRERINDKILQLKELIPSCAEQDQLHKMSILQSAIDYIAYLKDIVETIDGNQERVQGKHIHVKTHKPLLAKEIQPFTHQFSSTQPQQPAEDDAWSVSSTSSLSPSMPAVPVILPPPFSENPSGSPLFHSTSIRPHTPLHSPISETITKGLKPSDVIKAGEPPIIATEPPTMPDSCDTPEPAKESTLCPAPVSSDKKDMSLEHLLC